MHIEPVSETSLIIILGDSIDLSLTDRIALLSQQIRQSFDNELIEVIPSYTTIFVQYHPLKIDYQTLRARLEVLTAVEPSAESPASGKVIKLPVYYAQEAGPDLRYVAECSQLTVEEVIQRHSQRHYKVCAIGFSPGFAFLASVDETIATPRKQEPRLSIPAGSVGIADRQTAVYPAATPGGWQIIGNCPQPLFNPLENPTTLFSIGDTVQFTSIDKEEYLSKGGVLCQDWK